MLTNQISHCLLRPRTPIMAIVAFILGVYHVATTAADVATEAPDIQSEEPATLGSMDEQYAWVGDLGDRDELPGKPLYIEHCAG